MTPHRKPDQVDAIISFELTSAATADGPGGMQLRVHGRDREELADALTLFVEVAHGWPDLVPKILGVIDFREDNYDGQDEKVVPLFPRRRR